MAAHKNAPVKTNERTNILFLEPHVQLTSVPDEDQRCGVRNISYVWMASMKTKVVSCNKICNFSWSLKYFNKVIGFCFVGNGYIS